MRGIWRGEDDALGLRYGKEYEILGRDADFEDFFGVIDETGEAYIYPVEDFEIIEEDASGRREKTPHKCPICNKHEFPDRNSYDICPVCGWEDYTEQEDYPDDDLGPNNMSLNEYKAKYESGWRPDWLDEIGELE